VRTENDGLRSTSHQQSDGWERRPRWTPCSVETEDNRPAAAAPHCVVIAEKGRLAANISAVRTVGGESVESMHFTC
jgi:hypothetical protein